MHAPLYGTRMADAKLSPTGPRSAPYSEGDGIDILPIVTKDRPSLPDSHTGAIAQHAVSPVTSSLRASRQTADRLIALTSIGGLLFAIGLALVSLQDHFRLIIFLVFLFMVGLAPPLSAYLVFRGEQAPDEARSRLTRRLAGIRVGLFVVLLAADGWMILAAAIGPGFGWQSLVPLAGASALATAALLLRSTRPWADRLSRIDAGMVIAAGLAVFLLSPFNPTQASPIGLLAYAKAAPAFVLWLLVGALWTCAGIWLRRQEALASVQHPWLQTVAIVAAAIVVIGLYDDTHLVDFFHFLPLVGPALHAQRGGIPMVDVYSQYGFLPWAVYWAAFHFFEPAYGTAAVVVRIINVAYYATFLAILVGVSRRRLSALWFFIPALLVAVTSHGVGPWGMWNMNALPMVLGGRNLVPALMTLVMVFGSRWRAGPAIALGLIAVAAFSSLDILAFTLAPWGGCLLLEALRTRSWRPLLQAAVLAAVTVVATQLILAAAIWLGSGAVIRYGGYLQLFALYRPTETSIWSVPFVPYYALWFPLGLTYFCVLALATLRAFRREQTATLVERLVPVALLGLGPLAYFFGRPQEATLNIACLSFAVAAIAAAEAVFARPERFGPAGKALFAVISVAFTFTIADGFEHFMRPMDPLKGNATILRRCLGGDGCSPAAIARNIDLALHTKPLDGRAQVGVWLPDDSRQRLEEVAAQLRLLEGQGHRQVGLLTDIESVRFPEADAAISVASFMATRQWFPWPISAPNNDELSPLLVRDILDKVAKTPAGTPIIASNDRSRWKAINREVWTTLSEHCRLRLVHRGPYYSTFLTESCT